MSHFDHRQFDATIDGVDALLLPSLSRVLDGLLDSAALARPGHDADAYAAGLRETARQLDSLADLLGAIAPTR